MSNSPQTHVKIEEVEEEIPLNTVPGTGDVQNNGICDEVGTSSTEPDDALLCTNEHHRKLAIGSIICGLSCIGSIALIYSVKAQMLGNTKAGRAYSQQARKFSIISIVTWIVLLVSFPLLMGLISYLLTLLD